jgi:hypothetical protein
MVERFVGSLTMRSSSLWQVALPGMAVPPERTFVCLQRVQVEILRGASGAPFRMTSAVLIK